ncbi:MAG: MaoC family dehydratase [Chloroflexi bacterium]|nr:MaoC family dehydratase [Chloroflexota bacterium]
MAEAVRLSFEAGHRITLTKTVTDQDVRDFARLSGDTQGFHVDDEAARQSRFGQRIAHGTLAIGFISAVLGTRLPAPHESVSYLSQTAKFHRPMYIGDTITVIVEVTKVDHRRRLAVLTTVCTNQRQEIVLRGEATVLVDPFPYLHAAPGRASERTVQHGNNVERNAHVCP